MAECLSITPKGLASTTSANHDDKNIMLYMYEIIYTF